MSHETAENIKKVAGAMAPYVVQLVVFGAWLTTSINTVNVSLTRLDTIQQGQRDALLTVQKRQDSIEAGTADINRRLERVIVILERLEKSSTGGGPTH